jgi:hypothetical protein
MDQIYSFSDSYEGVELFDSIYIPALISDEFLEAISNMCIMVFHYFCVNVLYQMKPNANLYTFYLLPYSWIKMLTWE